MLKKLPFFLLGFATGVAIATSLAGIGLGLFHILAQPPSQDIPMGTVEILGSLIVFSGLAFILYSLRVLYFRVFPKQDKADQVGGE